MTKQNIFLSVLGAIVVAAIIYYFINNNKKSTSGTETDERFASAERSARNSGSSSRKVCIDQGNGGCTYYGIGVACSECGKRGIPIV